MGHVLRIISLEKDGDPHQAPNDTNPSLASARHIREVVRKQHGKHESIGASETLHATCGVLRTKEYIRAMEIMAEDDCSPEDFEEALKVVEDPESYSSIALAFASTAGEREFLRGGVAG